ncbi:MAG TPA: membrane protein insertase YidC [Steroidobacteraceae bacterium]|nr:membrane protein insertase YidC [Steroidobacteraceae bacterium]
MTTNYPRILLWFLLCVTLLLNYQMWVHDYPPPPPTETATHPPAGAGDALDLAVTKSGKATPAAGNTAAAPAGAESTAVAPVTGAVAPPAGDDTTLAPAPTISVRTDVLDLRISLRGGTLVQADLPKYPKDKGHAEPMRLENQDGPDSTYVLQSGIKGPDDAARPTHRALFTSAATEYQLTAGQKELAVPLTWTDGNGVTVTKTYLFQRGSYRIGLEQDIDNQSATAWVGEPYAQIRRNDPPTSSSFFHFSADKYASHGPAIWDGKYRKLKITDTDDRKLSVDVTGGWVAAIQHYFVSAVVPPTDRSYHFSLGVEGNEYALAAVGPRITVQPGSVQKTDFTLFVGPKLQRELESTGNQLDRVADYGRLFFIAKPLFWVLDKVHLVLHNWGWTIVFTTLLLKLALYPLSELSGRSMARMKVLQPRIKAIQESYKDDRQKQSRAVMELYQREKVNPLSGCLPQLVQIPIFFAYYWVLLESVEMRQAPFMGWIQDLSSPDPYYILPIIMAGAMFVQYKLNPTSPDPTQARLMLIMPFVLSVTFIFFPSGLVLYWVTNTLLQIAQQWNINRRIEAARKPR